MQLEKEEKVAPPESQYLNIANTLNMSCACFMAYSVRKIVFNLIHSPRNFYPVEGFKTNLQ